MKKIFTLLFLSTFLFTSCSSDGPQGPPGTPGEDGLDAELPAIFEVESDFNYDPDSNLWSTDFITFEDFSEIEVFETDVVLVYRLDGVGQLEDGSSIDEWSLIPQNFFTDDGTIQYVFNHTFVDTEIFIDGNYDISGLSNDFTQDQVFRIVIIPADFAATVDTSNMSAVMRAMNVQEKNVKKASRGQ